MSDAIGDQRIADRSDRSRPLLHLLSEYGGDSVRYLILGVVLRIVSEVFSKAHIFVLGIAIDAIFNDQPYVLPLVPSSVIPTATSDLIWFTAGVMFLVSIVGAVTSVIERVFWNIFAQRLQHDVRVVAFDTMQRLEVGFFESHETGQIISVLNNDVDQIEDFFTEGMDLILYVVLTFLVVGGYMALLSWQLTIVTFAVLPVIAAANYKFSGVMEERYTEVHFREGELNARLKSVLDGFSVMKALGADDHERQRIESASSDYYESNWRVQFARTFQFSAIGLLAGGGLLLTFVVGSYWVIADTPLLVSGSLTAGVVVPFLFYTQDLIYPAQVVTRLVGRYNDAKTSARRITAIQSEQLREETETTSDAIIREGQITYDDVTFTYPGQDNPSLSDVSFDIQPDELIGIVGKTGAGKSTVVKLLLRFYRTEDGEIRIDDRPIDEIPVKTLRQAIGYVSQEPHLFSGTVVENIAYGGNNPTRAEVIEAAEEAGADEFIRNLADGYDTDVGEKGEQLSGGQRQRIAIARALVGDPKILVFDEATSHVDSRTEAIIQSNLQRITEGRATIVIAHRLATVRDADEILVLANGEIVERGTHRGLLNREHVYARLWETQVGTVG